MVHVAFVRSVHAHALIAALELDAARHAPGVVAILTGEDASRLCKPCRGVLLHYQGMKTGAMRPLAVERVRYVGEPVVAIAAETRAAAEDACARVRIDWTPLPAVLSPEQAVAAGAPLIHADLSDNVIYDTRLSGATPRAPSAAAIACGDAGSRPVVTRVCRSSRAAWWRTSSRPRAASRSGCRPRCRT
jgi:carbon-monoxide dehydrogenase large subunit